MRLINISPQDWVAHTRFIEKVESFNRNTLTADIEIILKLGNVYSFHF